MRIVVCMKVVPRPEEVKVNLETKTLDRAGARSVINSSDMNALETALTFRDAHGGTVTVLSMGPPQFEPYLRVALAVGADAAVLLSDRAFGGADTLATSYTLATGIRKIGGVDLVLCGEESSDGGTSQVPPSLAEWLDASQATYVERLVAGKDGTVRATRSLEDGKETIDLSVPAVISVIVGSNEPRFIDYDRWAFAQNTKVQVWNAAELGGDPQYLGLKGSPTTVAGLREVRRTGRRHETVTVTAEEAASRIKAEIDRTRRARG
jgi:electron transfer flavoprotein alpha/beta subunit